MKISDILIKFSSNLPNGDSVAVAERRLEGEYIVWRQEGNQHATVFEAIAGTDSTVLLAFKVFVTVASCERSLSTLRRLKTWIRRRASDSDWHSLTRSRGCQ